MAKSSDSFLSSGFSYPKGKSGPEQNISFGSDYGAGDGDFLSGPSAPASVAGSSEHDSPVKGPGFGDSKVVAPGDPGRSSTSYGSGS